MSKLFLVMSHEYDDSCCLGVFSTKEKAQDRAALRKQVTDQEYGPSEDDCVWQPIIEISLDEGLRVDEDNTKLKHLNGQFSE